jgi:glycosyltransferase involved in cell wall biosynthesis
MKIIDNISLIILSCKRFSLFKRTIESLQKNCLDLDLISQIILVDDNSELHDLILMQDLAKKLGKPLLLVSKHQNKGHAISMNIAWDLVKTEYCLLLEDDWECVKSDNFIKTAFQIFNKHDNVVQVQYHRKADITAIGQKTLKLGNKKYIKYDYNVKSVDSLGRPAFPGFTLNPSLINVKKLKENNLRFREDIFGFEFNYACQVAGKGLKIAYFTDNYFQHIGKNNSAYKLNETQR